MSKSYFEIIRPGINSTFQDLGRFNQHHIGIPLSGVMDKRNYLIGNKLVGNSSNISAIEFAYQGPILKIKSAKVIAAITGNVTFKIIRANSNIENGKCYETFELNDGDQVDIISTNKSVYGYFFINGGFEAEAFWDSFSINTGFSLNFTIPLDISLQSTCETAATTQVKLQQQILENKK